jgi:hypothetical protein
MAGAPVVDLSRVRAMVADAKPMPRAATGSYDPPPGQTRGGVAPGEWVPGALGLPEDCPVLPLGIAGSRGYFIDPIGQIQVLEPPYGKGHILGLFSGRANYLTWAWPRFGKNGIDGYAAEVAAAGLIAACAGKGPFSLAERVRGRGMWRAPSGELVLHTGISVFSGGKGLMPGEYDGYVYPTRAPIPGPWPERVGADANPAALLLPMLRSWNWVRPEIDPILLLGWIGASFLGGALPWRPTVYITGDKATGKSTLQSIIKSLLAEHLVQAADTSAAGIYQRIGQDCLPVAVDELEGEVDVRKQKAVLKLARLAASGALMLRGGDRHEGVEFQARSCFLFSSINTPPLEPQDMSRMAVLRLRRLPEGQVAPDIDPGVMSVVGRCILRRMMDEWPRFVETYKAFRTELGAGGMDGRAQDQFGTLLTCADMIAHEGWNEERLRHPTIDGELVGWRELMAAGGMAEMEDAAENWRLCLSHMLSVPVDAWRNGIRHAVGQVLEAYWCEHEEVGPTKRQLNQAGLTLVRREGEGREAWLAVPNQNALTRNLFVGSKWGGDVCASVWAGALRQAPLDVSAPGVCRINGDKCRATLISLEALYGAKGMMRD